MNIKVEEILMVIVAFIIGYFLNGIINQNLVEGDESRKDLFESKRKKVLDIIDQGEKDLIRCINDFRGTYTKKIDYYDKLFETINDTNPEEYCQ